MHNIEAECTQDCGDPLAAGLAFMRIISDHDNNPETYETVCK